MKSKIPFSLLLAVLPFGCVESQNGNGDKCQGVVCDQPPADRCKDAGTLIEYQPTGTCDPQSGECQYTFSETGCPHGCAGGRCLDDDLGDDFALVIPAGTSVCSLFSSTFDSSDIFRDYEMKGRIQLAAGQFRLPRDQDNPQAELVVQVELTPERTLLQSAGPGEFSRQLQGTPDDGVYLYSYQKPFTHGSNELVVEFDITFETQNGAPVKQVVALDGETLAYEIPLIRTRLVDPADQVIDSRQYTSCAYENYQRSEHDATVSNGDTLHMDQLMTGGFCKICPGVLEKAVFTRGNDQREVSDHFRRVYSAEHHNWNQKFLVIFDEPVGSVHGLYLYEETLEPPRIKSINYLDSDLQIIETVDLSDYQVTF